MQKQWGLFIGAVGFFAATLVLTYLAGPDPYPRSYSGGHVATWTSRSGYVEHQIASSALALVIGSILFLLCAWRPWWFRRRETRDYWATQLPEYRRITTAWILRLASVAAIGLGLLQLATVALPASAVGRTAVVWVIVAALVVEAFRGALQLRPRRDHQRANDVPVPSDVAGPGAEGTWPNRP